MGPIELDLFKARNSSHAIAKWGSLITWKKKRAIIFYLFFGFIFAGISDNVKQESHGLWLKIIHFCVCQPFTSVPTRCCLGGRYRERERHELCAFSLNSFAQMQSWIYGLIVGAIFNCSSKALQTLLSVFCSAWHLGYICICPFGCSLINSWPIFSSYLFYFYSILFEIQK